MVNGIRPARLIAKMLTIPFSDPDFTAPGLPVATLTKHGSAVYCVAVLADGRFVAGSGDNTVKVWKESSLGSGVWSVEVTLTGHGRSVRCVAVLEDGRLASGSRDKTVKVWG
jgi:WD40 repeat protein